MECDVGFLSHQLKVVDERTAKNRVFFVSAKEVLQLRVQSGGKQSSIQEGRGMEEGWKLRLMEFERLEGNTTCSICCESPDTGTLECPLHFAVCV